uniref:Protein phosphatase 2 regulatory subunit B''beta n=1 Tax=Paramormyrops kingsleyae TaxID=1676925 RepID=A0A3B3RI12_9TELE
MGQPGNPGRATLWGYRKHLIRGNSVPVDAMRTKDLSLRQDPDLRKELAMLARGCDFVLPSRFKRRLKAIQQGQVQPGKEETISPEISENIPKFYFPGGKPKENLNINAHIIRIQKIFSQFPNEKASIEDMGKVAKACQCPLYWKAPLFHSTGGDKTGFVSVHNFTAMWIKMLQTCHDDASKFVHLLAKPGRCYLEQEDFIPFLQDVVNSHASLAFLKKASDFHSRYITTVIQRIFYNVNRSWTGRISSSELRRSNFLENVALLEEETDVNQLTDYFSYEHFYVIYCKFWELDTDHDLYISQSELAQHSHQVSRKIIERIFSGTVTRNKRTSKDGRMSYADFVWFLISEEDKKTSTSIEYWFRCMDLDGDGVLSMYELEYFYQEQCHKLESMSIEPLPFEDCLCQMLDLVNPQTQGKITLCDLKRCKMSHVFFDTFFNIEKYLEHEQRDPFSGLRDQSNPYASDWEKYASEEYDVLLAEEMANEQEDNGNVYRTLRLRYENTHNPVNHRMLASDDEQKDLWINDKMTGFVAMESRCTEQWDQEAFSPRSHVLKEQQRSCTIDSDDVIFFIQVKVNIHVFNHHKLTAQIRYGHSLAWSL